MCMIAGYTGNRRAVTVLVEMLRREEGFWAGFYTGIAEIIRVAGMQKPLTAPYFRLKLKK